jgi:AcrR family transcriptional regulator
MSQPVKRRYNSTRRQEQARETRLRIIRAAHRLFVAQGYGRTTIAEIAASAGVAVETVYAAFRNKPTLLRHVWYMNFRGDDKDIRLLDRPEIHAVLAEPDLPTRFSKHAVVITAVFRRIAPLLAALQGAAATEPAAAAMLTEWNERRLDACTSYAEAAAATGQLAVSQDECRDGRHLMAAARRRARMARRALRRLARPPLDLAVGQAPPYPTAVITACTKELVGRSGHRPDDPVELPASQVLPQRLPQAAGRLATSVLLGLLHHRAATPAAGRLRGGEHATVGEQLDAGGGADLAGGRELVPVPRRERLPLR